jgi:N-acetylglutamate synthase-like GNAT family acetyltransferase
LFCFYHRNPRLKTYKKWLALVYTTPDKRHQGYGGMICKHIQSHSKNLGLDVIYLFTDTAEQLYKRLGWTEIERLSVDSRNIVVMSKDLLDGNKH